MRLALKVAGVFVGSFVALVSVQIYQYKKICDEKRNVAIQMWAENNDGSELILSAYHKCIREPLYQSKQIVTLISYADCAVMAGSQSLADKIKESTRDVDAPIPLRWL
ncbi:hypothetical protein [Aeromonas veronii]|uniref:hypothetical protein n=1 Tax=Aeromonas veronii TaxID=654 RepID=UPI0011C02878|nr:hypothetical protein [Aeromonas veronii]